MPIILEAKLHIKSRIDNLTDIGLPDGSPEITEQDLEGFLKDNRDGSFLISYAEFCDGEKTLTDIFLSPDGAVRLTRRGAVVSDILFREGEEYNSLYSVPPYSFDMKVVTKRLRSTVERHGGEIRLMYVMDIGGQKKSVRMTVGVRAK